MNLVKYLAPALFLLLPAAAHAIVIVSTDTTLPSCNPPYSICTNTHLYDGGLIANGDFYSKFLDYSGTLTTVTDNSLGGVLHANDGSYQAYFADTIDRTLNQTVITDPGTTYLISFVLSNDITYTDAALIDDFSVYFGNTLLLSLANVDYFGPTKYSFYAAANGPNTALGDFTTLKFIGSNTPGGFFLTDLAVNAVPTPEPGSLVLLATGILGATGMVRRRLQS